MNGQVTLTLPAEVLERAELLAQRTGRAVNDLLAETIELSLRPLGTTLAGNGAPEDWPDEGVLAAAALEMQPADDLRLSSLLARQQAGNLTDSERPELMGLMQVYQERLLVKAQALREAVRRGLREPLPS